MAKRDRRLSFFDSMNQPTKVRCYDNGDRADATFDRYTVVFTGRYRKSMRDDYISLGSSCHPFHPQGFGSVSESDHIIDRPGYSHLGKRVSFSALPEDVKNFVVQTYNELWGF